MQVEQLRVRLHDDWNSSAGNCSKRSTSTIAPMLRRTEGSADHLAVSLGAGTVRAAARRWFGGTGRIGGIKAEQDWERAQLARSRLEEELLVLEGLAG
jgi:hypothetical protein